MNISIALMNMSSIPLIDNCSETLSNAVMFKTIEEIRLERLLLLKSKLGSVTAVSDQSGMSYAQVSQWINQSVDSKTGKPRAISSTSARSIEVKLGLERGWFDQPVYSNDDKITNMFDTLTTMSEPELKKINDVISAIFPDKKKSNSE